MAFGNVLCRSKAFQSTWLKSFTIISSHQLSPTLSAVSLYCTFCQYTKAVHIQFFPNNTYFPCFQLSLRHNLSLNPYLIMLFQSLGNLTHPHPTLRVTNNCNCFLSMILNIYFTSLQSKPYVCSPQCTSKSISYGPLVPSLKVNNSQYDILEDNT